MILSEVYRGRALRIAIGITVLMILLLGNATASDWPMYRKDVNNTGNSLETINLPLVEQWHSNAPSVEENGAVVSKGIVYMSTDDGKLYAFDVSTGATIPGFPVTTSASYGSPAVDPINEKVYVLAGGKLYAVGFEGIIYKWTQDVGTVGTNYNQGPIIDDGYVYVKAGGNLIKYNSNGVLQWSSPTSGTNTQPSILDGYVYINSESGQIRKYNKATGIEVKTGGYPITTASSQASLTTVDGKIFHKADKLYSYNANDGSLIWAQSAGGDSTYYDSPAVSNGVVYVYGFDGKMYAFDKDTGATISGFPSASLNPITGESGRNWGSPAVAGDKIFIGAGTTKKFLVLGAAGTTNAGIVLEEHIAVSDDFQGFDLCSPIISDGVVFAMLDGGGIYAFFSKGTEWTGGAIKINNGAGCTDISSVSLTLDRGSNTIVNEMRISESPLFTGAIWEPYSTTKQWTLSSPFGSKTIYVQFRDSNGQLSNVFNAIVEYSKSCGGGSLFITPSPASVIVGKTLTFNQFILGIGNGNVIWSSSDPNVGTIKQGGPLLPNSGIFTAKAPGITVVKATSGTFTGTAIVTVYQGFRFMQLTDVHIGPSPESCDEGNSNSPDCWQSAYETSVKEFNNVKDDVISNDPDFVVITGDSVNWNSKYQYRAFNYLISKFAENNIKVYIVPGNHDRRGIENPKSVWESICPQIFLYSCFNDLNNYIKYIGENDISGVSKDKGGDSFDWGGYRFIGLDSGYDKPDLSNLPDKTPDLVEYFFYNGLVNAAGNHVKPRGTGLCKSGFWDKACNDPITYLKDNIEDDKTIIFMHHPAIDDDNGYSVISENREEFIKLMKEKKVKLVLTGHTHFPKIFYNDENGKDLRIPSGSVKSYTLGPLFVQTRSATQDSKTFNTKTDTFLETLHGYAIVDIGKNKENTDEIFLQDVQMSGKKSKPITSIAIHSPADLHLYDEFGRHTGLNTVGGTDNNVPDTYYSEEFKIGNTSIPASIFMFNNTLNYTFKIISNFSKENIIGDQASFNLTIKQMLGNFIRTINYNNVLINSNSIAYLQINTTQTNFDMQVDLNNDSVIDTIKIPDTIITDYAPIATITSPASGSSWDQGQPITFSGTGFDTEDGTLTNLTWISDRDDVIGHGNFMTSNLSAGIHIITLLVKDTAGQVNTSNIFLIVNDTKPPVLNIDYPPENKIFNKQNIAIKGTAYDDGGISNVTANDIQAGQENWNATILLNEGENIIEVVATDNKGFRTIVNRRVYYDSSLASDTTPPAGITNLAHKTGYDSINGAWINWTWDNPTDLDFSYVIVYLDDIPMGNTSRSYFNFTGLSSDADYNISILTADIVDNINYDAAKDTARTPFLDTAPPVITNISNTSTTNSAIISWDTNEASDSLVKYGTSSGNYPSSENNSSMVLSHSVSLSGLSSDTVFYYVVNNTDSSGNSAQSTEQTFRTIIPPDEVSPTTDIVLSGTLGNNNWYTSDVQVNLTATDNDCGSGVNRTEYSFDNATWIRYSSEFTVSTEGTTTIYYYSVDNAGNIESTKNQTVKIDKTLPNIVIAGVTNDSVYNVDVTPIITITDVNLNTQMITLNGTSYISGTIISTQGNYALVVSASDMAGNNIMKTVNFVIEKITPPPPPATSPPEASIRFNVTTKNLTVYNNETGEGVKYTILPTKKGKDGKEIPDEDGETGWQLRQYTLNDLTGNSLVLVLKNKNEGKSAKVKIVSTKYNSAVPILTVKNSIQAQYSLEKNSAIKEMEQKIDVNKQFQASAKYNAQKKQTEISVKIERQKEKKVSKSGIVILEIFTDKGGLKLRY